MNSYFDKNVFPGNQVYNNYKDNLHIISPNYSLEEIPLEQSYIENILRLNKGRQACVHITIPNSEKYKDNEFKGIIEQAGKDHLILSEPTSGKWNLIPMIYIDFITFDEKINYLINFR